METFFSCLYLERVSKELLSLSKCFQCFSAGTERKKSGADEIVLIALMLSLQCRSPTTGRALTRTTREHWKSQTRADQNSLFGRFHLYPGLFFFKKSYLFSSFVLDQQENILKQSHISFHFFSDKRFNQIIATESYHSSPWLWVQRNFGQISLAFWYV